MSSSKVNFFRCSLTLFGYLSYVIAISVLACELLLRYLIILPALQSRIESNRLARDPLQTQVSLWDSGNLRFVPNSQGRIRHQEYDLAASHDRLGYRNPCFDFSRAAARVVVGDSFVYGIGVGDQDTFSCKLNAQRDNIYTIGFPGADPAAYISLLGKIGGSELFPKGIPVSVVMFMGNDFEPFLTLGSKQQVASVQSHGLGLAARLNGMLVTHPVLGESRVLNGLKLIGLELTKKNHKGDFYTSHTGSSYYRKGVLANASALHSALVKLREAAEATGFVLEDVLLLPDPNEISLDSFRKDALIARIPPDDVDLNFKFDAFLSACAVLTIRCVDLRPSLIRAHYYVHDNHLTPDGVSRVAATLDRLPHWGRR